jgi:Nucleotidyltransferase of unknown function (DUF6036)
VPDPLQTTLADAIALLTAEGIEYALVGGLAASLRGEPRVTADVDFVIAVDIERALSFAGALADSPFRPLFDDVQQIIETAFILPLRHRITNVKVDLAIGLSGFEQQTVARAQTLELAGVNVSVATAEDLVIMKVLAGRPQDEQDLRGLIVAQRNRLDWDYCLRIAAELGDAIGQDLVTKVQSLRDSGI